MPAFLPIPGGLPLLLILPVSARPFRRLSRLSIVDQFLNGMSLSLSFSCFVLTIV